MRLLIIAFIAFLGMGFVSAKEAHAGAMLADLENALMCKCDDKCGKVLINCTCSTSDKTRAEFSKLLDSGLTVDQIIQMQVDKYGETVLSAPTKNGFNLTAWVAPFAAILIGGLGVRKVIDSWMNKNNPKATDSEVVEEPEESSLTGKYASRLQKELDEIEQ